MKTHVFLGSLLLLFLPVKGQYEADIERLRLSFAQQQANSAAILFDYLQDHPEIYQEGTDMHLVYRHWLSFHPDVKERIRDESEFVAALVGGYRKLRPKRWGGKKTLITGLAWLYFDNDSLMYGTGSSTPVVYVMSKRHLHMSGYHLLKARGVELIFSLYEVNSLYHFGLTKDRLWVAKLQKEETEILTWEEFLDCCAEDFWLGFEEWRNNKVK